MSDYLENLLVEEDEIAKSLRERRKKHIEKTVSVSISKGKTKGKKTKKKKTKAEILELLNQKAALEKADGWEILRKSKYSFRLKKDKPLDEQLEDKVWTILARMGFDELSDGRNFKINNGKDPNPRQIDVFAKDRETALVVECTCCEKPTRKSMRSLIEKMGDLKHDSSIAIKKYYEGEPKLKIGWIIATRNVEWSKADLEKAHGHKITVITQNEIEYYSQLTDHLKKAAKYQLLSHFFKNEEISALKFAVSATRGKMGTRVFYNFLIKPSDLLKIAYIMHKASRSIEDLETYQRMLSPKRLKDIALYIDNGGQFPTNIVVNMKSKRDVKFEKIENVGGSAFGTLYLPKMYASCLIIDGQHRLYGYMQSERSKLPSDKTVIPVLAYEKLSPVEEATYFVDINSKQVRVPSRLLHELWGNLRMDSEIFSERIDALRSNIVKALNSRSTSPLRDRIIFSNTKKTHVRCLTNTNLIDGLKDNKYFGTENKPGPFTDSTSQDLEKTMEKAVEIIDDYLSVFAKTIPSQWELGDDKCGYLFTNLGIRALFETLREILWYIEFKDRIVIDSENPDILKPYIRRYIKPVVDYFDNASQGEIDIFRARGSSKDAVRKNSLMMMQLILDEYPDFLPTGLKEFMKNADIEGTKEAIILIDNLQQRLYSFVVNSLKSKLGDDWWYGGIPGKITEKCGIRQNSEKGVKKKEQYLLLINYRDIALKNWELFKKDFGLGKGSKSKRTEWIVKLNEIRNITHHPEKWPLLTPQVNFVRKIYAELDGRFQFQTS